MVVVSSNFTPPETGVLYHAPLTKLLVEDQEVGVGALYVTEENVVWGGNGSSHTTVSLLYPTLAMHAIQREPSPALIVVVNYDLRYLQQQQGAGDSNMADEDEEFDPEDIPTTKLSFIPQTESDLQGLYNALNQGQALHPDPQDVEDEDNYMDGEDEDEGDSEEFEDAEESNASPDDAASRLRQMKLENGTNHDHDDEALEDAEFGDD